MELSQAASQIEAAKINQIKMYLLTLDVDYLKECHRAMSKEVSFRESAMILNPSPFTAMAQGDLDKAKLEQLHLFIQLAENFNNIHKLEQELSMSKNNVSTLNRMFGL